MTQKVFYKTTKINLDYLRELIFVVLFVKKGKNYTIYGKGNSDQARRLLTVVQ